MEDFKRWLRDWGVLVVAAIFTLTLIFTARTAAQNSSEAQASKRTACHAVQLSNDALISFLKQQFAQARRPSNPEASQAFLANLQQAYANAELQCLQGK